MFNLGPMEVLVIVVVTLVVLGPQRLPEAMRQAGRALAEVRRWSSTVTTSVQSAFDDDAGRAPVTTPAATAGRDHDGLEASSSPAPAEAGVPA